MKIHDSSRVILLAALAASAFAQTSSQMTGTVTDKSGAVVAGAVISVTNVSTGVQRTVNSNEAGVYTLPFLNPGEYSVTVQKEGFRPIKRRANVSR
jgi:hypothetical protein